MNDFGILYVATGEKYLKEVEQSAASAKGVMPDISITLWTDNSSSVARELFDDIHIITKPTHSFFDKILPLLETSYEKTLYLDTDTLVIEPIYELSILLDRFDIAYCHAPWRICPGYDVPDCPIAFAEPNTGVILFKRSDMVNDVFRAWSRIYLEQLSREPQPMHDQPAFREALYESSLRLAVLPPEYNLRTIFPVFAGGNMKVKILHGREPSISRARENINCQSGVRIADYCHWSPERVPLLVTEKSTT